MLEYLLRLALLLPLLAGLIWGSLWLTRWLQQRLHGAPGGIGGARQLQLVETSLIAPGIKLAVVRFRDREILLGCTRQGMVRLGEAPLPAPSATAPESV
ncbi:flagellar biosynthetic protein FliO [Erythrobacter sp. NE805]|uniref:flagellar biosynthetic protein FliO n=1 Tax=Erythrobacter sp. NE805 TaxID=3389875 RepID=UPI00396AF3C8